MKRLLSILILLCLPYLAPAQCWGQAGSRSAPQQHRELSTLERASVRIRNITSQQRGNTIVSGGPMGSGTIIAYEKDGDGTTRALVLTCHHLFPTVDDLLVDVPLASKPYRAKFLAVDDYADLGLIAITGDEENKSFIELATDSPARGTKVYGAGYPSGRGPTPRVGHWIGFDGSRLRDTGAPVHKTDLWSDNGDSGSGIYADGYLVAVLWGGGPDGTATVGLPEIYRFLCKQDCLKTNFPRLWALLHKKPSGGVPVVNNPTPATPAKPAPSDAPPPKMPQPTNTPPVAGPAGPQGPQGNQGKDGQPGPAGKDATVDYDKIATIVASEVSKQLAKQQPAQPPQVVRTRIVPAKTQ